MRGVEDLVGGEGEGGGVADMEEWVMGDCEASDEM